MKKILTFIFGILLLISCDNSNNYNNAVIQKTSQNQEYLNINGCKYYKIKIGNHDVYQYKFSTYTDNGSDIIHFNDMCDYCETNNINKQ